ncbi:hypothetical protein HGRIS_014128 [Hohenbuehelia grisea]|uniref:GST N-terminal domain-containing protein n=1 Tax=Hohenbuehelia grisea TaxID=104357 RepID=A0ABR3JT34_9AGAR
MTALQDLPKTIIFLDIPTRRGAPNSPNTWKVRLLLNYKGLEYTTQWVPSADIERTCKSLDIPPTGTQPNGEPRYTLPALVDNTKTPPVLLSDSVPIMEYLDGAYPASNRLAFPGESRALQYVLQKYLDMSIWPHVMRLMVMDMYRLKLPADQQHFRTRLEAIFGQPLEQLEAQGEERVRVWGLVEGAFGALAQSLAANGDGEFFMGKSPSYADFAICAVLIFFKTTSPEEAWGRISKFDSGRWDALYHSCQKWAEVDGHPVSE